uniref:Uncharacterized protein n=1 Tax=Dulem virus 35 TaxID=3145753 RepID=A0AAU8B2E1_9CAUD
MEPITRKEMYLAKISGDYSGAVPEPVTRMDYYMACAAGAYERVLPRPIRQQEFYWAYICGATDIELPAPITRVDIYLAAICGGNMPLPKPITREEMYLYKIAGGKSSIVKAAAGKTIVLTDSLEAPFEDFRVYGRTTQETTTGAQLLDLPDFEETKNGVTCTVNDGIISLNGISAEYTSFAIKTDFTLHEGNYILTSFRSKVLSNVGIQIIGGINVDAISFESKDFSVQGENNSTLYVVINGENINVDGFFMRPMISENAPETYEPYTGGKPSPNPDYPQELVSAGDKGSIEVSVTDGADNTQSLTLSTPNGLSGIPVSSGGNYTDENGQQWICDEVDFGRGVYVQRIGRRELNGNEIWFAEGTTDADGYIYIYTEIKPKFVDASMCSHSKWLEKQKGGTWDDGFYTNSDPGYSASGYFEIRTQMTIKEWKSYLQALYDDGNPVVVQYALSVIKETDLSADELAAYRVLHTNTPTTTITNDEDCWMEVGYQAKIEGL